MTSPLRITFEVLGSPAPKGSGRAILVAGRAQHVASGSDVNARKLKSWDTALREAAALAVGNVSAPPFIGIPLRVTMIWRLARPRGHFHATGPRAGQLRATAPLWPLAAPDGSKLLRSTEDTLTGIVWDDDARLVEWFLRKSYARPGREGASITVEGLSNELVVP